MARTSWTGLRPPPECHALFVAGAQAPTPSQAIRTDSHLRLTSVASTDVMDALRGQPRLALVWVDSTASDAVALVAALKALEPGLPIIWSSRTGAPPTFGQSGPDLVLSGSAEWQSGVDQISALVNTATYHAGVVQVLCTSASQAIEAGWGFSPTVGETFLKASRAPLASVSAAVEFGGRNVEASIIVSAEAKPLREILRATVPTAIASLAALHDLSGEIANHIVGRLKVAFDREGKVFVRHTPLALRGNEANIRAIRGRPSLVARLLAHDVELFIQLRLKGLVPSPTTPSSIPSGELKFFGD